ncbi:primary-amine oxidase [Agrococcus sp. ProA11]|uniref:primary-amine oxidase n=1 Tax=Agrococcus chionoecetis TaxID=3153752 RepID=UPI003260DBFC
MPDTTHTHGARDSNLTEVTHPLAPLAPTEIERVRSVLDDAGELQPDTRFPLQVLLDPPKAQLAQWGAGDPLGRRVLSTLLDTETGRVREAVVALDDDSLESIETLPTGEAPFGQPPYLFEEYELVDEVVKADAGWRRAMEARGLDGLERALVVPLAPGQFNEPDEVGKRMMRSLTFMPPAEGDNPWSFPVEGLVLLVDVTERKVVKLVDERQVPLPQLDANYDDASVGERRTSLKPIDITMPEGPSFSVDGNAVTWEQWRFRIGFSMREGLVLHQLGWQDGEELRPVLHRASVPEMVVPYGDTSETRRWISYFDAGEYNLGKNANAQQLGCDCLGAIHYFDAHVAADTGEPITIPRAVCMHEEDYGVLWKHRELDGETTHGRRSRRLVVSYWATVGNYDYGFFWYLYLDGSIQFEAKATGIVFCGADEPGAILPHATEIAPALFAPIHQHIFCARLDFDIDGTDNYVDQVDLVRVPMGDQNPWGNAFGHRRDRLSEAAGVLGDGAVGRTWHIGSSSRTNAVGRPTEFQLIPEAKATLMADPESTVHDRATFASKHLWVTSHRDDDLYPAGRYPNQHSGGAGLPESVAAGGDVDGADLVVWHSFGLSHIPRPEDWPIMPVDYSGFWLKPYGFLDRNPALDVPEAGGGCGCAAGACSCDHGHSAHGEPEHDYDGHHGHHGDDGEDHVAVR